MIKPEADGWTDFASRSPSRHQQMFSGSFVVRLRGQDRTGIAEHLEVRFAPPAEAEVGLLEILSGGPAPRGRADAALWRDDTAGRVGYRLELTNPHDAKWR